jgi:hypothetical protein
LKELAMRPFFSMTCLIVAASLVCAAPLDARGGKGGGGGGGRGRASSGRGGGGGGPKWSGQQSHAGGGGQRLAEHGQKPTSGGDKHQFADKQHQPGKDKEKDKSVRSTPTNNAAGDATDAYNKKQKQLEIEQRNRDKRLAQAQHLREIGERNGNQNLLDNADRMEAFAHDHYARRVSHLEKFGVTDPTLNPGGGVTDRLLPGTDGFADPLGDVGALDLLPFRQ